MPAMVAAVGRLALVLVLGGAGGGLLAWLGAPAPWLSGAMLVTAIAAASGLPVAVPDRVRALAFILLGTSIGSTVTPDTWVQMRAWPGSFGVLAIAVAATMVVSTVYLTRVHGWERVTARFSSIPGALSQVLILALRSGGDLPRIALAQSLRVFVLVALLPWLIPGDGPAAPAAATASMTLSVGEIAVLLAASGSLGLLLERLGMPAGFLFGAMVASAALHGTGLVTGRLPAPLLTLGFIVTGCVIGTRFVNMSSARMRGTLPGAFGSVMLAVATSALFALVAQRWFGLPFGQLWLAYAPGGVEVMTIMAFALGFDPTFVGAHHVVRLIALNILVPLWLRGGAQATGRPASGQPPGTSRQSRAGMEDRIRGHR